MSQVIKTKTNNYVARLLARLAVPRKKLPDSWIKARGMLRDPKQIRALESHVKKVRAEWR